MHYVYVLQPIRRYCTINAKSIIIHHALKVCLKVYIKCQTIYICILFNYNSLGPGSKIFLCIQGSQIAHMVK